MRPAAEVVPVAVIIDRDLFARRQVADQLGLVGLADLLEMPDRLVARPHLAPGRQVPRHDLAHLRFDLRQIVGRERRVAREVVIEAVLDRRADGDLGAGKQLLHRHREQMRGVVADQLQRLGILPGDDAQLRVLLDGAEDVPLLAVDLDDQRRLGEARADRGRDLRARHPAREIQHLAVGQGDVHFGSGSGLGHGFLEAEISAGPSFGHPPKSSRDPPLPLRDGA